MKTFNLIALVLTAGQLVIANPAIKTITRSDVEAPTQSSTKVATKSDAAEAPSETRIVTFEIDRQEGLVQSFVNGTVPGYFAGVSDDKPEQFMRVKYGFPPDYLTLRLIISQI